MKRYICTKSYEFIWTTDVQTYQDILTTQKTTKTRQNFWGLKVQPWAAFAHHHPHLLLMGFVVVVLKIWLPIISTLIATIPLMKRSYVYCCAHSAVVLLESVACSVVSLGSAPGVRLCCYAPGVRFYLFSFPLAPGVRIRRVGFTCTVIGRCRHWTKL